MLAPDYPYGPLKAGECVINSGALAINPDLKDGDTISIQLNILTVVGQMAREFNQHVRDPSTPKIEVNYGQVPFPCTIKDIMDEPYGKYLTKGQDFEVIMEFNEIFPYVLNYVDETTYPWVTRQDFVDYLSSPKILE